MLFAQRMERLASTYSMLPQPYILLECSVAAVVLAWLRRQRAPLLLITNGPFARSYQAGKYP
jgi:hypothetical protein